MKLLSAEFIKSSVTPEQFPPDRLPEIAFVGRSNVGKVACDQFIAPPEETGQSQQDPWKNSRGEFLYGSHLGPAPLACYRWWICRGTDMPRSQKHAGPMGTDDRAIS